MTCPKRSEARRSNATRCRSYAPWQLSVNVLYKAKRGTQKVRIFRYITFFCPKQRCRVVNRGTIAICCICLYNHGEGGG